MSYHPIDDSGEFNDSVVYLHPLKLTENTLSLARPNNPPQLNLGIYEGIKLTALLRQRQGSVVELVSLDVPSRHAFVTEEGEALLRQFASNEVAFVMVGGNGSSGKSFFCDKVLNLCEVRGNHFCRSKNTGINVWSAPFEKDDLKIFLLQINGCSIQSEQFKVLLTYSIMIGSAFIIIDDLHPSDSSALQQFDFKLAEIVDQITPSRLQAEGGSPLKRNIFLPEFFYFLRRAAIRKENQSFSVVSSFIEERLPDALASGYKGEANELIHLPFLDTKCISEEYMRKVGSIFSQVYEVVTEKRYNELNLTGSIVLKIIKYIENYLNSSQTINIEDLYDRIIEDLYQSAYNYCILSYHEQMERHFQNEEPKSIDELVSIFERASFNVLDKFQQFTLDEKFHQFYREKLQKHIDEKELMILDINKLKTQRMINSAYDPAHFTSYDHWKSLVQKVKAKSLNHGSAEGLGRAGSDLLQNLGGVDHASLREIQKLTATIDSKAATLVSLKQKNEQKSKERSLVNKQQEDLYQSQKRLENKKKELKTQIQHISGMNHGEPQQLAKERQYLEQAIKRNNTIITDLKKTDTKKNKNVFAAESKIEQTARNITQLEKILSEMKSNPQVGQLAEPAKKEEKKGKPKP